MTTLARRQRYRDAARQEIVDAARDVFSEVGFESFSMRKLAARAGCSLGAIYLYFEGREALFEALVEDSFAQLLSALEVLRDDAGGGPLAQLRRAMRIYVDFGLEHPSHYRVAFLLRPLDHTGGRQPHAAFGVLRQLVASALAAESAVRVDVETASQALFAAAHGITSLLILRPTFPWVNRDVLIQRVIDSAVDGIMG
jgi:AcrR family transcriptional regulator